MRAFIVLLDHPFRVELCSSVTSGVNFDDKSPFVIITLKVFFEGSVPSKITFPLNPLLESRMF